MENQGTSFKCQVCSVSCNFRCGSCNKVSYCSKKHQKSDWKKHKSSCFPAKVNQHPRLGRHLIATKNIRQGEIILREKPLLSGPSSTEENFPVCLGCYCICNGKYACSKCHWPVCCLKCQQETGHSEFECQIFSGRVPPCNYEDCMTYNIYDSIKALRCLILKEKDPNAWEIIRNLESHVEARKHSKRAIHLSKCAIYFVREVCGLTQFDADTVDYISGVLGVNCFGSDERRAINPKFRAASYLYPNGSMNAHSCQPNSFWYIQLDSELILRASVPIKENEQISQLYVQATLGTFARRKELKEGHYFWCECRRCADPTELNTFFSAVKCPVCSSGYLLAERPLDEHSNWKCNNYECSSALSAPQVLRIVNEVKYQLESVSERDSLENIDILEHLLEHHCKETLHRQHYLIHGIEYDLLQRISYVLVTNQINTRAEIKEKLEKRQLELCRKCLDMSDIIWPGYNRYRGRLLYFLQQALTLILIRTGNSATESGKIFDEIEKVRREGREILSIETRGRDEFAMAERMATAITSDCLYSLRP